MKKIFTLLCVAFLATSLLANVVTGTCGDNLQWAYDTDTHALTITGSGDMYWSGERPWEQVAREITSVSLPDGLTSIGSSAFSYCSSLTSITIPNSVTNIGWYAFSYCSSLASVTIPNSVTSIGNSAFRNCSSLTSITIPNSVTSIEYSAFFGCSSLTSITIPNSVIVIGELVFRGCSSLTSIIVENGNTIYDSRENCNAIIETATNTLLVGCQNTIIPNSVTSIGISSFIDCSSLTSITIPNSVVSIASFAFWKCTSLTSLTIPNSVTSIEDNAFGYCVFTKDNFINRSSLDAEANNYWGATIVDQIVDGLLIRNDTVIDYIGNKDTIVIPDGVLAIADEVFRYNSKIKSVTIPNSVTSIGKLAFDRCSALTSITIPESVTTIGNNAFEYCTNLTSIVWNPVSCTGFWTEKTTYCIFYGCENVTSITFGDKVTEIPRYLCWKMPKLTSITIPESVKTIEEYAFSYCYSLDTIIIPDNVTDVKRGAFYDCSHLKSVTIGNGVKTIGDYAFYDCVALQNAILGNRVTTIGKSAFYKCSSLTSLTIPNSVTSIGSSAFDDCFFTKNNFINNSSLDEVANKYWGATIADIEQDGLLICNDTVVGCRPMVTSVVIPNTITCIGDYAFRDCSSLTSITIPNSVTSIRYYSFYKCSSLTSVTIPNSVTSIGNYAFSGCSALTSMVVEEGNATYDSRDNCNAIIETATNTLIAGCQNTIIPNSVTSIGNSAFNGCSSLNSITIPNSVINIGRLAFEGTGIYNDESNWENDVLYIDNCLIQARETFTGTYDIKENTRMIGGGAFWFCTSLESIIIPESVTNIGEYAFVGCESITSIDLPNRVTTIGKSAFGGCSSLTFVTIPNSVTSIGESAFGDCSSLTSVTIPNSVTSIGESAFGDCSSLTSITIPNSVTSIGNSAFRNCSSLTSMVVEEGNTTYDSRDNCNAIIETATNTLFIGCGNSTIPNSVTSIGNSAFYNCSSLTSITIPNSVTSIGNLAFRNCSSLDTIYLEATTPPTIERNTFTNTPASICYIPCGTKSAYEASAWAQYMDEFVEHAVELTSGICGENLYWEYADTKLIISGTGAMYDNIVECLPWAWLLDSIRSIEISEGVTHIAAYAFDGCSALRELHLPASVLAIGEYAFGNTPRLYEITCLATEPPVADASSFTNYDAYLHAYCDAQRYYSIDPVWKNFHNVECIVTEDEVTGDVTITPSDYEATVVWLSHADAAAYALVITKNDVTFCTLKFNKYGQLTNIAFAPSRTHHNKQQAAEATPTGYSFTITGLDENTTYGYAFSVLNEESTVIEEFVGEFTTQSNASTAVDNVDASTCGTQKLLRNGQLLILRDGKTYTIMGQEL